MNYLNKFCSLLLSFCLPITLLHAQSAAATDNNLIVKHTKDFIITGDGSAVEWKNAEWNKIIQRSPETLRKEGWNILWETGDMKDVSYETTFKILYSDKGIYCLYKCEDSVITATIKEDYGALYDEDVVEAFFRPDTSMPVYIEYELSPLNYELPILIVNKNGNSRGWKPWQYTGANKTIHAVNINRKNKSDERFAWTAEFFVPFTLLIPMENVPPSKGTQWRANFYRIDYDQSPAYSSWRLTRENYHDYERFGVIEFE